MSGLADESVKSGISGLTCPNVDEALTAVRLVQSRVVQAHTATVAEATVTQAQAAPPSSEKAAQKACLDALGAQLQAAVRMATAWPAGAQGVKDGSGTGAVPKRGRGRPRGSGKGQQGRTGPGCSYIGQDPEAWHLERPKPRFNVT